MYIQYIESEYRGLLEYDFVLPKVKSVKFVPLARYQTITQAFYNINYFRR